jgi:dephospho-CoA kinase
MIKIGLTGGIGSGKSTVAQILRIYDIPVYDADSRAKALTATHPDIRRQLTGRFGDRLFDDGTLNRQMLASLIFGNEDNLSFVNSTIHPHVFTDFRFWCELHSDYEFVVAESAILFESGFRRSVDFAVAVSAPEALRIERIVQRDGCSQQEALRRVESQMRDEEKNSLADFVIINNDSAALLPQTENLLKILHLKKNS